MREHLGAGNPFAYFQYDSDGDAPEVDLPHDEKETIVETLRGMAAVVLEEEASGSDGDWSVRFGLGWAAGGALEVTLVCTGSERPERPYTDFTLEVVVKSKHLRGLAEGLHSVCFRHGVSWSTVHSDHEVGTVALRQRVFSTGCNPDTIRHVVGNHYSCWQLVAQMLRSVQKPVEREERVGTGAFSST
jgi:hypothetical protein